MIVLDRIRLQRGPKILLEHASLQVHPGDKLALVGANGSGKSSLFALLRGRLEADRGEVQLPDDWRIAWMAQEVPASPRCALDYVLDGHEEFRELEQALAETTDGHRLAELHARFDAIGGHQMVPETSRMLAGLGFAPEDSQRPVDSFSGGWRLRLNLARALLQPSELMLLDEPTNHLDLDATLWLEQWLARYSGTLLLISHDRDFIDGVCTGVVHLDQHQLVRYRGHYSAFERQRSERLLQQQAAHEQQQRRREEITRFIERFRAQASKARQAQSRIKALERMGELPPARVTTPFSFTLEAAERSSDPLLSLQDATLGYGDQAILQRTSLTLHPGSRIGLLGANGAGKSTLIKALAGELKPLAGRRTAGQNLALGYFNQHQLEALDLEASAALHLQRLSPQAREQDLLDFLGRFNFRGDQATGSIRHFSGGEKARLALALIAWQRPNLLLLDEPTNHLDLDMCQALTEALQDFTGAMVLISHDRHLLRHVADELWLVSEGRVRPWEDDLEAYRDWLLQRQQGRGSEHSDSAAQPAANGQRQRRQQAAARREQLRPLRTELRRVETRMERLQTRLDEMEAALADPALYQPEHKDRLQPLLRDQGALRQELSEAEERWLALQEKLESLQAS